MTATSLSLSLSRVVNHNACCSNDIDLGRREGSRDRAAAAAEGQNSGAKPQPRRWQWQARPILPFVAADRNHVASSMEKNRTRGSMSATRRRRLPHHQLLSGGAGGGGGGGHKEGQTTKQERTAAVGGRGQETAREPAGLLRPLVPSVHGRQRSSSSSSCRRPCSREAGGRWPPSTRRILPHPPSHHALTA